MYTAVVANILNVATNYVLLYSMELGVMYVCMSVLHAVQIKSHSIASPAYYNPFSYSNHLLVPLWILSIAYMQWL